MTVAELAIGGMTCASCAARIERKLNGLDGVSAAVNFATETARVTFPATVTAEDLVSAVERAGYTALLAPGDPPVWEGNPPPQTPLGCSAAGWRRGPGGVRARRCGPCCRWAPRTSRCGVTAPRSASQRPS